MRSEGPHVLGDRNERGTAVRHADAGDAPVGGDDLSVRVMIILQIDAKAGTGRTRTGLALHFTSD